MSQRREEKRREQYRAIKISIYQFKTEQGKKTEQCKI